MSITVNNQTVTTAKVAFSAVTKVGQRPHTPLSAPLLLPIESKRAIVYLDGCSTGPVRQPTPLGVNHNPHDSTFSSFQGEEIVTYPTSIQWASCEGPTIKLDFDDSDDSDDSKCSYAEESILRRFRASSGHSCINSIYIYSQTELSTEDQ